MLMQEPEKIGASSKEVCDEPKVEVFRLEKVELNEANALHTSISRVMMNAVFLWSCVNKMKKKSDTDK